MCPENLMLAHELGIKKLTLTNADVKAIFEVKSNSSVSKIKKPVLEAMASENIFLPVGRIHLATAYTVWGLDKDDLERRYHKAKKLG